MALSGEQYDFNNLVAERPHWIPTTWAEPNYAQATFSSEIRPYHSQDTPGLRPSHASIAGSLIPVPSLSRFLPLDATVRPHNPTGWNARDSGQPASSLNLREHESTKILDEAEGGSIAWFGVDDSRGMDARTFDGGFAGLGKWRPSASLEAGARVSRVDGNVGAVGGERIEGLAEFAPHDMEHSSVEADSPSPPVAATDKARRRRRRLGEPRRDEAQRRHLCTLCPSKFARPSALQIHLLAHSKVKSHLCPTCQRPFAIPSNLRRHLKIHAKVEARRRAAAEAGEGLPDDDDDDDAEFDGELSPEP